MTRVGFYTWWLLVAVAVGTPVTWLMGETITAFHWRHALAFALLMGVGRAHERLEQSWKASPHYGQPILSAARWKSIEEMLAAFGMPKLETRARRRRFRAELAETPAEEAMTEVAQFSDDEDGARREGFAPKVRRRKRSVNSV